MLRDLNDEKTKLYVSSTRLKTIKFLIEHTSTKEETLQRLIREQDEQYKRWLFYKNYIEAVSKEKRR